MSETRNVIKQLEWCRIGSRIPERLFRTRQTNFKNYNNRLISADTYGVITSSAGELLSAIATTNSMGLCSTYEEPLYPHFSTYEHRCQSFIDYGWARVLKTLAEPLAKLCYFYKKENTLVYCYFCGVGVRDWELFENSEENTTLAVIQHCIARPQCPVMKPYYTNSDFQTLFLHYDIFKGTTHLKKFLTDINASEHEIQKYECLREKACEVMSVGVKLMFNPRFVLPKSSSSVEKCSRTKCSSGSLVKKLEIMWKSYNKLSRN